MVELIGSFLERGVAYQTSDGVYFDVSSVPDYGLFAGQPLDSLRAGAREKEMTRSARRWTLLCGRTPNRVSRRGLPPLATVAPAGTPSVW